MRLQTVSHPPSAKELTIAAVVLAVPSAVIATSVNSIAGEWWALTFGVVAFLLIVGSYWWWWNRPLGPLQLEVDHCSWARFSSSKSGHPILVCGGISVRNDGDRSVTLAIKGRFYTDDGPVDISVHSTCLMLDGSHVGSLEAGPTRHLGDPIALGRGKSVSGHFEFVTDGFVYGRLFENTPIIVLVDVDTGREYPSPTAAQRIGA